MLESNARENAAAPQPTTDLVECQYGHARYLTEKETKLLLNHSPLANFQNPRFGDPCFLIYSAGSGCPPSFFLIIIQEN